jgi:PAP2 superfamily
LNAGTTVVDELDELTALIEYRPAVMQEALAQRDNIPAYWQGVFGYRKATHPCTFYATQGALRIAEFCAMYQKNIYQRPRPSQLSPNLMPPIVVPGHASFPSAHASESYTLSLTLAEIFRRADVLANLLLFPSVPAPVPLANPPPPPPPPAGSPDPLTRLAQRISRNREVLGLHYPSDSAAGLDLAQQIFTIMLNCPTIIGLMNAAATEWVSYTTGGPL